MQGARNDFGQTVTGAFRGWPGLNSEAPVRSLGEMLNGRDAILAALCATLLALPASVFGWNQWTWRGGGPGQRAAHSLHVFNNYVYLFGGRSNDTVVPHRPKTYEIQEIDGVISFASYDRKLVTSCSENDTALTCLDIHKGVLHNDIWRYQLGACKLSCLVFCYMINFNNRVSRQLLPKSSTSAAATASPFQHPRLWLLFCEMLHCNGVSHNVCLALAYSAFICVSPVCWPRLCPVR